MKIKAIVAGIVLLLSSNNVFAQSAAFTAAANGWLHGDEVSNLELLSKLAHGGDTSAQLLLGQIDRDTVPGGFSDYLADLDHGAREDLLRSDVSEGSKNWLLNLSDPAFAPLGEAIFNYRISRDPMRDAVEMQKHGENAGAEYIVWDTFIGGRFDRVNAMPAENYGLSGAGFLTWVTAYMSGENKALTANRLLKDNSPDKVAGLLAVKRLERVLGLGRNFSKEINQFITIVNGQGYNLPDDANLVDLYADIARVAEIDGPLSIVVRACDKCTTESVDYECVIQSLEIVGGYKTLMNIRTPVENVIPADAFLASDRPVEIFDNLLKSRAYYYSRPIRSTCVASFLADAG